MTHLLKLELKKFRIMPNVLFSAAYIDQLLYDRF